MTKESDRIIDIRFLFDNDNPCNDQQLEYELQEYLENHPSDFKAYDWVEDSKCYNVPNLLDKRLFNQSIPQKLVDNTKLSKYVFNFFKQNQSDIPLDEDLVSYISSVQTDDDKPNELNSTNSNQITTTDDITSETKFSGGLGIITDETKPNELDETDRPNETNLNSVDRLNELNLNQISSNNLTNSVGTIKPNDTNSTNLIKDSTLFDNQLVSDVSYSVMSDKQLSYQDVCRLTLSIARLKLTSSNYQDESVIYAEEREKTKLREQIQKYMKLSQVTAELGANLNVDIDNMNLKQLQFYNVEAKKIYEKMKVIHLVSQGIDGADKVYSVVFKEGIKIPGTNKSVKLNNIGESLKQAIFDRRSPFYVGFENLIEKYNLSVSDELLAVFTLAGTLIKNVEIVDNEPKPQQKPVTITEEYYNKPNITPTDKDSKDNTEESEDVTESSD